MSLKVFAAIMTATILIMVLSPNATARPIPGHPLPAFCHKKFVRC